MRSATNASVASLTIGRPPAGQRSGCTLTGGELCGAATAQPNNNKPATARQTGNEDNLPPSSAGEPRTRQRSSSADVIPAHECVITICNFYNLRSGNIDANAA